MTARMDKHQGWQQGAFIDSPRYRHMGNDWKAERREAEKLLIRSSPMGNPICTAVSPDTAAWIAERLNLASRLEAKAAAAISTATR